MQRLAWDSGFWGMEVGTVPQEIANDRMALETALIDGVRRFDFIQASVPLESTDCIQTAQSFGFYLVDVRCVVELTVLSERAVELPISRAQPDEIAEVAELAAACHTHTRYANDPSLDGSRVKELYRKWIFRDAAGDGWQLGILREGASLCGYATMGVDASIGTIGLIGVNPSARGRGVGLELVRYAGSWCAAHGASKMHVVTQAGSRAAMKMYQRAGYNVADLSCWLHWHRSGG